MDKKFDVYSIGNPLIDILARVSDEFLEEVGVNKGIMHLIDTERRKILLEKIPSPVIAPGGSAANTLMHLADFGLTVTYSGALGDDTIGEQFKSGMIQIGCHIETPVKPLPSGTSIILITPDAERTQNTYLGACQLYSKEDVNHDRIKDSRFLYFTGYMWDTNNQKEALVDAIETARNYNTSVIFDVADPFAVNRSKEDFLRILRDDVDFVLANREEGRMLTGQENIEAMIEFFRGMVNSGVIKDGSSGSYLFDQSAIYHVPAEVVHAIDTTGAGDIYASGIIYGLARNYDFTRTGKIATHVAGKIVQQIGARLTKSMREKIDNI